MTLSKSTAIVTGGTGALGRVVVKKLFDRGANIAVPVRSSRSVAVFSDDLRADSGRFLSTVTDLTVESQVKECVDATNRKFGSVDVLVNLAGGYAGGNTLDAVELEEWDRMMALNLRTAFLMSREVLKVMKKQRSGRIISISAMPALLSGAKKGPYAISKLGIIGLTKVLADELKDTGITANAIAPSTILTEENKSSMPDADSSKWVTPEEIADTILYLCSDDARSMNGNVLKMFGRV